MDFTTDKIQTLLDPKQGLRAVGLGKLEDLNIKQLQKVAEEVNKKYRIKNYKTLSKAKIIEELKTRFPHLALEEGKLEDLSLKAIQTLTVKYQNEFLIKNINKMNKSQLIEAIRRVAPHLEDTPDVRLATPETSPEPEDEPEPDVVSTEPTKTVVNLKYAWDHTITENDKPFGEFDGNPYLFLGDDGKKYLDVKIPNVKNEYGKDTQLLYRAEDDKLFERGEDGLGEELNRDLYKFPDFNPNQPTPNNIGVPLAPRDSPNRKTGFHPLMSQLSQERGWAAWRRKNYIFNVENPVVVMYKNEPLELTMYGVSGFRSDDRGNVFDPSNEFIGKVGKDIVLNKYPTTNKTRTGYTLVDEPVSSDEIELEELITGTKDASFTDPEKHSEKKLDLFLKKEKIERRIIEEREAIENEKQRKLEEIRQAELADVELQARLAKEKKEKAQQERERKTDEFLQLKPIYMEFYSDIFWDLGGGWSLTIEPEFIITEYKINLLPKLVYMSKKYKGDIVGLFYNWIDDPSISNEFRTDFNRIKRNTGLEAKDIWAALVNAYKLAVAGEFELAKKFASRLEYVEEDIELPFNLFNKVKPSKPRLQTKLGIYFPTLDVKGGGNIIIQPKPEYGGLIEALKEHKIRYVKERKQVDRVPFILPDGTEAKFRTKKKITKIPAHTITPYDWIEELFSV